MRVGKAVKDFQPEWAEWDGTAETAIRLKRWSTPAAFPLADRSPEHYNFRMMDRELAFLKYDDPSFTAEVWDFLHSRWIPLRTGDFVMKGAKGECYPCAKDVFSEGPDKTYTITEEWTV